MSNDSSDIYQRALKREKEARKQAERILEVKSRELYYTTQELKEVNDKLENLLDETSAELKGVFENIIDAFVLMDIEGNVLKLNDAAINLFGYNIDNEDLNVVNLIYEEDYGYAMKSFEQLVSKGYFKDYQARVITKHKEVKWVHINASLLFDKNKQPVAAQGIVRDITDEREQGLIIEVLNNVAKSILGKMDIYEVAWEIVKNIAEYLQTDDCIIYLVNDEQKSLEQIAVYGKNIVGLKQHDDPFTLRIGEGIVGAAVQSGKPELIKDTSLDPRYVKDDAHRLSEIVVPIVSGDTVIALIDSEHPEKNYFTKEHLQTLQSIANLVALQLKSAINIREKERAEAKSVELLRKLELSNQELQEYAHIVSHDLKSPLRSINALVNWIKEDNADAFDEASLQNFDLIDTTLEKMEQLISDILLFSSIDSGATERTQVDLNSLVGDLKKILYVPEHVEIVVHNFLPMVYGDKVKLQQLFQNLISNAVKFIDKEKGMVEIDFKEHTSFYEFSVKDNGMGIEKKHHKKIFKIFHALDKSKTSSGIGLSIVKKIIDHYGGEIWLESEVSKGTIFHFTLKKS